MAPGRAADSSNGNGTANGSSNGTAAESGFDKEVPVLIVGGGPTGLLQAHTLSKLGVKNMIVERYPERLGAPKAHALSPRSLEICRQFGLDVKQLRELGTPRKDAYWVNFITNLSGEQVGVLPYERMDEAVLDETPEMIHNIPQPDFENFVAERLAADPNVELRKGISFCSLEQHGDYVVTTVEERATGRKYRIRSRHVIACDGASSKVRQHLGIESEGEDSYETMMTIHFNADLRPVVGKKVGMLHWVMDPLAGGFIIGYHLSGNQVLISNFDSKKHPVENWNEDLCRSVVDAAIGQKVPFDVLSYRPWILSRKVANQYRQGNVFLVGDAAHSFPPTGGLGLNSGLADVHNLAYRIAAVHHDQAKSSALDGYEHDRHYVAEINSKQSVKNGKKIFGLLKSLGTTNSDVDEARKALYATLADPAKRADIDEQIEGQREHFDNLELHIGYVYGSKTTPPNASDYTPKYVTGARLPHAWITLPQHSAATASLPPPVDLSYVAEMDKQAAAARQYSALDLCQPDAFTLIVGADEKWEAVAQKLQARASGPKIVAVKLGPDFELLETGRSKAWVEDMGLGSGGGMLVRPDQHILLPLTAQTSVEQIVEALDVHLGLA